MGRVVVIRWGVGASASGGPKAGRLMAPGTQTRVHPGHPPRRGVRVTPQELPVRPAHSSHTFQTEPPRPPPRPSRQQRQVRIAPQPIVDFKNRFHPCARMESIGTNRSSICTRMRSICPRMESIGTRRSSIGTRMRSIGTRMTSICPRQLGPPPITGSIGAGTTHATRLKVMTPTSTPVGRGPKESPICVADSHAQ